MFCYRPWNLRNLHMLSLRMSSKFSYQEAVEKLNTLQSNKASLEQMKKDIESGKKRTHLDDLKMYLQRSDITLSKLDELSVIHIAGTKGKGSTSAMCESILRHHGYKTGFYSSPHLVVVRERIKINGENISEDKFSQYFSDIYTKLQATSGYPGDMPKYFHFLTLMAFHVFLKEKVDVVILEVGIGGIDDSTNIVRNPQVVGITALGLDHTSVLGNTIEEIAKAKAGIIKPGCDAYTVIQPPSAMTVLQSVAREMNSSLCVVPDYVTYTFSSGSPPKLPVNNEACKMNSSLAIQLAHSWLRKQLPRNNEINGNTVNSISQNGSNGDKKNHNGEKMCKFLYEIPHDTIVGLEKFVWPGRYQVMDVGFAKLYLDGAHTKESMEICVDWFVKESRDSSFKILIFSATGDRNSEGLLQTLITVKFQSVYFVVPAPYRYVNNKSDTYSLQNHSDLVSKCHKFMKEWSMFGDNKNTSVHECIWDVFVELNKASEKTSAKPSVLITGSLYLVGGVLSIFNPKLKNNL